ncbi:Arc family DNA-binding protein [Paracoccus denitrificans]|uniref:Arc family DNA-binding protein n=1 Tax=Paracoccus denitrificans TaxID=266 RepID=UPI001E4525CB|nr:Arc family DNA-binding protein [Paracoccus denitrificans]UFS65595.1 Arc family DNA-binding protein [Paracoccus denitrificans]
MEARFVQIGIRFPRDIKRWLECEAKKNGSSQNSEVIRAIRQAMSAQERHEKDRQGGNPDGLMQS